MQSAHAKLRTVHVPRPISGSENETNAMCVYSVSAISRWQRNVGWLKGLIW